MMPVNCWTLAVDEQDADMVAEVELELNSLEPVSERSGIQANVFR